MQTKTIEIRTDHHSTEGILQETVEIAKNLSVILAHGAGGNMHASFMRFFQDCIAREGYRCLNFNFPYAQARKKMPDPQPVLIATFRKAIETFSPAPVILGGKSMGGRIASYIHDDESVKGYVFLGYPLHAPGKTDQLRDEHLYQIRKPMFFASGTKDPFARFDLLEKVVQKIGVHATLFKIEGGGHSFEVPKSSGMQESEIRNKVCENLLRWLASME